MTSVPIDARPFFHGATMGLGVLNHGGWTEHQLPVRPYCYSRVEQRSAVEQHSVERRVLSTGKKEALYQVFFNTTLPVAELNQRTPQAVLESHVRYPERVAIDCPDFYRSTVTRATHPRVLVLDTEGLTRRGKSLNRHWIGLLTHEDEVIQLDQDHIKELPRVLAQHDLVVGYNIHGYDWPHVVQPLCQRAGIALDETFYRYDLARTVFSDQTLHGIKSRGLKSVARWYGMEAMEVDGRNTADLPLDALLDYNVSDLWVTRALFDIYYPRMRAVAEYMGVPLSFVLDEIPSTVPSIAFARGFLERGIVTDGTNEERHPDLRMKVQGAFTSFGEPGLYHHVVKLDFKQMYPSILLVLNLGPDTTTLVGFEPLSPFRTERRGRVRRYWLPDENVGKTVVVDVDESHPGIVRDFLVGLGDLRDRIKAAMKGMSEGEKERSPLHAQENAVKVLRNTVYGYNLSKHARFADLATGITVTAVGRTLIRRIQTTIEERWGRLAVLEADTDGIYCQTEGPTLPSMDDLREVTSRVLEEWSNEHLGASNQFVVEYDQFPAGYFAKTKNYVLLDKKDHVIVHGSGFKGRQRMSILDMALTDAAGKLLKGEMFDPRPYYRMERYAPEDFLMRTAMHQELHEYPTNALPAQVARQYLVRGERVTVGSILEYYRHEDLTVRAYFAEDEFRPSHPWAKEQLTKLFTKLGLVTGGVENIEASIDRAVRKEVEAALRGQFETCPQCHGDRWYLPKGKVVPVDCKACTADGKVLVIR
ncbi:MAG: ribonuclease H-like domain-containing protein [Euryarchaeota archaeon]|nr:ribonuclease H-like domain-containing protein [Euryarchaeota archaeon]MDE1879477.1 ribonuclease H-like domain-containing protein [Euryarchaeota archaeon]